MLSGSGGVAERPVPGASNAIRRGRRSASRSGSHIPAWAPMPLMSSSGGPSPDSSTCSRMPSTLTCIDGNLAAQVLGRAALGPAAVAPFVPARTNSQSHASLPTGTLRTRTSQRVTRAERRAQLTSSTRFR